MTARTREKVIQAAQTNHLPDIRQALQDLLDFQKKILCDNGASAGRARRIHGRLWRKAKSPCLQDSHNSPAARARHHSNDKDDDNKDSARPSKDNARPDKAAKHTKTPQRRSKRIRLNAS